MGRKLHIGGRVKAAGWEVLDANPGALVDHVANANDLSLFSDHTFERIYASHVVEHFDYKDELSTTLKEWHRVLIPAGILYVSVPDLDILARLFLDRESLSLGRDRFSCHEDDFRRSLDKYDYHLVGLNEEFLGHFLRLAGFPRVDRVERFGMFNDTSDTEVRGVPISLNVVATKAG